MRHLMFVLMSMIISFSVGCASSSTGPAMDAKQVAQIKKGVTTRSELSKMLGAPSASNVLPDGRRLLVYSSLQSNTDFSSYAIPIVGPMFSGPKMSSRNQQLQVYLNKADVVEDYEFLDNTTDTNTSGWASGAHAETKVTSNIP